MNAVGPVGTPKGELKPCPASSDFASSDISMPRVNSHDGA